MTVPAAVTVARDQLVCDMIAAFGWDNAEETGYPLSPGSEIHDNPDKLVFITATGGPGYVTEEGGADAWSFQARVRGPADQPQVAIAAGVRGRGAGPELPAARLPAVSPAAGRERQALRVHRELHHHDWSLTWPGPGPHCRWRRSASTRTR